MRIIKALSVPVIILTIGLVIGAVFASLEPAVKPTGNYTSQAEAISASFK